MIGIDGKRVLLYPGFADFRYGIPGLSRLIDPKEPGVVYAFCGKSRKSLKLIEFERDRIWLCQVSMTSGRFQFPSSGEPASISASDLMAIISSAAVNSRVVSKSPSSMKPSY